MVEFRILDYCVVLKKTESLKLWNKLTQKYLYYIVTNSYNPKFKIHFFVFISVPNRVGEIESKANEQGSQVSHSLIGATRYMIGIKI